MNLTTEACAIMTYVLQWIFFILIKKPNPDAINEIVGSFRSLYLTLPFITSFVYGLAFTKEISSISVSIAALNTQTIVCVSFYITLLLIIYPYKVFIKFLQNMPAMQ